jgi:hypothetical protein
MFSLHLLLILVYLVILVFVLSDSNAAFENGALIFAIPGLYLGFLLASALSNSWVVAQVEVGLGFFALVFSVFGTIRDWNDQREIFVSIFNTVWTLGLFISFSATIIHYIALKRYKSVLLATYGTSNPEQIVFGKLTTDRRMSRREQGESIEQLLQEARNQPEDISFIGKAVDTAANSMFTIVRASKTRRV